MRMYDGKSAQVSISMEIVMYDAMYKVQKDKTKHVVVWGHNGKDTNATVRNKKLLVMVFDMTDYYGILFMNS